MGLIAGLAALMMRLIPTARSGLQLCCPPLEVPWAANFLVESWTNAQKRRKPRQGQMQSSQD
jgi:hypothetical protein